MNDRYAGPLRRGGAPAATTQSAVFDPNERHFTVDELAGAWHLSPDTVRRLFVNEVGVLNLGKPSKRKRIYRPLRIPEHVAARVYARITIAPKQ